MKPQRIRVALLVGGPSAEHEVSLLSGRLVHQHLDKNKYEVVPIIVSKKGDWPMEPVVLAQVADVAFVAMHGEYGEDGTLQELLRDLDMPYTGSDVMSSTLAMNKAMANRVFRTHGLRVPNSLVVDHYDSGNAGLGDLDLPVVVKPVDRGSAVGTTLIRRRGEFAKALDRALAYSRRALVQEYIPGRELAVSVVDDGLGNVVPLPVAEINPKGSGLYDYAKRYTPGAADIIIPAYLSNTESGTAQAIAARAHEAVGASGVTRTDLVLGEDGEFYILEINTIPGMTEMSLLPKAALAHGIGLPELFERIVEAAFIRHKSLLG